MSDAVDPQEQSGQPPESMPVQPSTSDRATGDGDSPAMEAIDREVAEAMASMDASDFAELGSGISSPHADLSSDTLAPGSEITGTVASLTDDEVLLEFGPKAQGLLPRSQFGKKEVVEVGRRIDVVVEGFDKSSGMLTVNRKGAAIRASWTNLSVGAVVQGKVTGMNKGGLEVDLNGIRAFMPASQAGSSPMKDISVLLGETVKCEVVELDRRNKNVLVSRRKILEKEAAEKRAQLKEELEVGQTRKGIVGNITDYGAFVDIGGMDGLLHIRDLSWGSVEKVSDILEPGQEIEVRILKIDTERDRISLGLKQCLPDPWKNVEDKYPVESAQKVRVVRLADFGAFAELESGVDGLIPISEMGWTRINRTSDVVTVGDLVDVVVIRVEPGKRRIALSMKRAQADPWAGVHESYEPNSIVKGRVTRLADFGAFVELVPGVEALIHISELSESRVRTCADVVQVGQEIEAKVLGVEQENRRISLSIKALTARAPDVTVAAEPEKKPKKRKKPLRGGLSSHFDW